MILLGNSRGRMQGGASYYRAGGKALGNLVEIRQEEISVKRRVMLRAERRGKSLESRTPKAMGKKARGRRGSLGQHIQVGREKPPMGKYSQGPASGRKARVNHRGKGSGIL